MEAIYYTAIVLLAGFLLSKLASLAKLPNVTGYLVGGLLIGPSVMKLVPKESIQSLGIISEAALGMIAFSIGSEFSIKHLKKLGSGIITLTVIQALGAFVAVFAAIVFIFGKSIEAGLIIGAVAVATAPAATLLVVRQYRAKGPVVDTLLPVVAIDDAVGIIVFGLCMAVAKTISSPTGSTTVLMSVLNPVIEIVVSLGVGALLGLILVYASKKIKNDDEMLSISLGIILLGVALAWKFHASSLLLCMMAGAVLTNFSSGSSKMFNLIDKFTPPIFIAFFTLSGADLDLGILKSVGLIGIGYIAARSIGKIVGAYYGAKIINAPPTVKKYLGITLLPQAGVAIGLSLVAQNALPELGSYIRTIVLFATLIYELAGPLLTKIALVKAGEIDLSTTESKMEHQLSSEKVS